MKKGRFFDKNLGLTSLRNVDFWEICRTSLLRTKKLYFLSRISKNVSFWLFLLKEIHIRKRSIFWRKPWTYPFGKCRNFLTLLELHFRSKKHSLLSRISERTFFLAFFAKKKKPIRKWSVSSQKLWTNPFLKCRFFRLF